MWEQLSKIIEQLKLQIRVSLNDGTKTNWSDWLIFPSEGYGEIMRHGPFLIREIEFIEINSIEKRKLGKLLPEKNIDHSKELELALNNAEVAFEKNGFIYRIFD